MRPTYLTDQVNYIEKESAQHGGKTLWVIGEIQRAQRDLMVLDSHKFLSRFTDHQDTKNPLQLIRRFAKSVAEKVQYMLDKHQINQAIAFLKKMYGLTDEQIAKIEEEHARLSWVD